MCFVDISCPKLSCSSIVQRNRVIPNKNNTVFLNFLEVSSPKIPSLHNLLSFSYVITLAQCSVTPIFPTVLSFTILLPFHFRTILTNHTQPFQLISIIFNIYFNISVWLQPSDVLFSLDTVSPLLLCNFWNKPTKCMIQILLCQ